MPRRALAFGVLLAGAAALCAWAAYDRTDHYFNDWLIFEVGARVLTHYHHEALYADPRLHVYVDNPDIQIGPPALWLAAAFQWLKPKYVYGLFSILLPALGAVAIFAADASGGRPVWKALADRRQTVIVAAAGVAVAGIWGYEIDFSMHLDDAMALTFTCVAAYLISRGRAWWLIGILLGTGIATKPWTLILVPVVLGLPRRDIARTMLTTIGVCALWWAPFVIAAPATISTLADFKILPDPGSVLYLVGIHGPVQQWFRQVQFIAGLSVAYLAARRCGWSAAPLAAVAVKVLTDPYSIAYYGLAPLLFGFLFDRTSQRRRGIPVFTMLAALLEFGVPRTHPGDVWVAVAKVTWAVVVLAAMFGWWRKPASGVDQSEAAATASGVAPA